jgi:glycosyltransferase involved in cell wall biosynthesis
MHIGLNAHLLSSQPGYRSAGIHQYIDNLLRELPNAAPEHRYTAMVGARQPRSYAGMTMHKAALDTESPPRRILWEQAIQPWSLRQVDLYHALAFVAPALLLVPMVVTIYDLSFFHYPDRLPRSRRLYLQRMTEWTCRRARRIIAISHSTARDVAATFGIAPERIDVAPPGCDFMRFRPLPLDEVAAFRREQGLPPRFWLFIGTLEPRKNLVTLLEAYAALPEDERLPLVIAGGKGWDTEGIFAAVERYRLGEWVRFPGFVSAEALALWYNAAEAFVYPSVFEGFGIPVLEAMACGTPVITSDATSLPEVVGDAGLCLPPQDVSAWTAALRRVHGDERWRADASERGLAWAQRFTWRGTAALTAASYRKALD